MLVICPAQTLLVATVLHSDVDLSLNEFKVASSLETVSWPHYTHITQIKPPAFQVPYSYTQTNLCTKFSHPTIYLVMRLLPCNVRDSLYAGNFLFGAEAGRPRSCK
ncbi:hypothetical protein CC78DRAFT_199766 [Lojkania enalia]|uniref:Uncharacterized protein n=1 Tax=Lojkania enalia TaxID=147567 RepID=A0A9P4TRF9_9PLEO|nr:hypothetical protein CC78DRAFT_199766 [Didymosphaeria enalia]